MIKNIDEQPIKLHMETKFRFLINNEECFEQTGLTATPEKLHDIENFSVLRNFS